MKKLILLTFLVLSSASLFAETNFSAVWIKETNVLSVVIEDHGFVPPFEAGEFWKILKGPEQSKMINETNFNLHCRANKNSWGDMVGECHLSIPMEFFQKIGETQVLKLKGAEASRLNIYFTDSAYLSFQRGNAYLSSYNTRREFFFGIKDSFIKR